MIHIKQGKGRHSQIVNIGNATFRQTRASFISLVIGTTEQAEIYRLIFLLMIV